MYTKKKDYELVPGFVDIYCHTKYFNFINKIWELQKQKLGIKSDYIIWTKEFLGVPSPFVEGFNLNHYKLFKKLKYFS